STPTGTPASKFFLQIDHLSGGSSDAGHAGWFDLPGFDFDVTNVSQTSANGTKFSPLTVDLPVDGALATALLDNVHATLIPSIKIEGVTDDGTAVYDLTLNDVLVQKVHDEADGKDQLSFDYGKIALVTQQILSDGSLAPAASFSYDVNQHTTGVTLSDPRAGTSPASTLATKFYLLIDGVNGGSDPAGHAR